MKLYVTKKDLRNNDTLVDQYGTVFTYLTEGYVLNEYVKNVVTYMYDGILHVEKLDIYYNNDLKQINGPRKLQLLK